MPGFGEFVCINDPAKLRYIRPEVFRSRVHTNAVHVVLHTVKSGTVRVAYASTVTGIGRDAAVWLRGVHRNFVASFVVVTLFRIKSDLKKEMGS